MGHKLSHYLVEKGENIGDICAKYKMEPIDLKRLNPILKSNTLHPGQVILVLEEDTNLESRNIKTEYTSICIPSIKVAFLIKEYLIANLFFKEYSPLLKKDLELELKELVSKDYKKRDDLVKCLKTLTSDLSDFTTVIYTKDTKKIKNSEKIFENDLKKLNKVVDDKNTQEALLRIFKDYQMMGIKIIAKDSKSAHELFNKILDDFRLLCSFYPFK